MNCLVYTIWPSEIGNHTAQAPVVLAPLSYGASSGGGGVIQMQTLQAIGTDQN